MELIRKYFKNEFNLSLNNKEWEIFSSKLKKQNFSKKHILLKEGKIEKYLSSMVKGIARFYLPKIDNDLTFDFAFENNFFSGYSSFLTQTPSTFQIETLTETILWQISFADLQSVYDQTEIGNAVGLKAAEGLFLKKSKREVALLNETAEQLYLNLLSDQPKLIQQIPLKYLASYIGITPQALSRIRKRIS